MIHLMNPPGVPFGTWPKLKALPAEGSIVTKLTTAGVWHCPVWQVCPLGQSVVLQQLPVTHEPLQSLEAPLHG
jgi:hypothetical protein